ncbi:MAG: bifunctional diaminohydroxyphosphoribosylaminopyrimidine deaminase/5-amino-6-(5-phosphoribosylamino)uracil reductase RibD [Polyangiaceae bacterium]
MMQAAVREADKARGKTGDNPWVGCVIAGETGEVIARGHTQGPGEDHAEIVALHETRARGVPGAGVTLYSTLEPCSFHGRTPACSRVILDAGVRRVVVAMRDPHPRVDGAGLRILIDGGVDVVEGVCEADVRRQLGVWVFAYHPHEPLRRARDLLAKHPPPTVARLLAEAYSVSDTLAESVLTRALAG